MRRNSHMELQVFKGDGWIVETSDGSVVLYDVNAPDIDNLRKQMGKKIWLGDVFGVLESIEYVRGYFGRYSAPGYLDATPWHFDRNKRRLQQELRSLYGEG